MFATAPFGQIYAAAASEQGNVRGASSDRNNGPGGAGHQLVVAFKALKVHMLPIADDDDLVVSEPEIASNDNLVFGGCVLWRSMVRVSPRRPPVTETVLYVASTVMLFTPVVVPV